MCGNDLRIKYAAVEWNNGENEQNQTKKIRTKEKSWNDRKYEIYENCLSFFLSLSLSDSLTLIYNFWMYIILHSRPFHTCQLCSFWVPAPFFWFISLIRKCSASNTLQCRIYIKKINTSAWLKVHYIQHKMYRNY